MGSAMGRRGSWSNASEVASVMTCIFWSLPHVCGNRGENDMGEIAEEIALGNVVIRQRPIGAWKKDHRRKYQRKK
jgi:hypothetical protein